MHVISVVSAKEITQSYTFGFDEPVVEETWGGFLRVSMSESYGYGKPGEPVLPQKTVKLLIPPYARVVGVGVVGGGKETIELKGIVEPGQTPVPISSKEKFKMTPPMDEIYSSGEGFPSEDFVVPAGVQDMRGYKILFVNLNPVKYSPAGNTLSYYSCMTVTLTLEGLDSRALGRKPLRFFRGKGADEVAVRGVVDNPDEMGSYKSFKGGGGVKSTSLVNSSGSYDYVIITNNALNSSGGAYTFHNLSVWKNSRGVNTTIVTVKQIMADSEYDCDGTFGDGCSIPQYNDTAAHVRNFIKDAYLNWGVTYVLLGGDVSVIPARGFYGYVASSPPENDTNILADQYYAALNGSWNSDNDSYWGEVSEMDPWEEVYVGRAPVETDAELSNFVRKIIHYESLSTRHPYLKKALMAGEKFDNDTWGGDYKDEIKNGSSSHGNTTAGFPGTFTVDTLYDRDWPGNNWPKSEIISRINNNIHIVNHAGHSNTLKVMKISDTDIPQINNTEYFFGYSQGCYAGNIGSEDCIIERFVKSESGAFAFIGNSRYGWYMPNSTNGPSQRFDREFFDALFGENLTHIGEAHQDSKRENVGLASQLTTSNAYRWCYYELNLLGDPETEIKMPKVEHDLSLENLEIPAYEKPNRLIRINVTLDNKGIVNETNLNVSFWVNELLNDSVGVSQLNTGNLKNITFNWSMNVEATYNITINVTNVTDEFILDNNIVEGEVIISPIEPVLLVDDDAGAGYESYYINSLNNGSIPYRHWDISSKGSPTQTLLMKYPITIWFTGNESTDTLTAEDQCNLQQYLDGGNSLLVTGQDVGKDIRSTSFYTNYLHALSGASWEDDASIITLTGVGDDPITDSFKVQGSISINGGANNQHSPSVINLADSNTSIILFYDNFTTKKSAALRADTSTYRMVYLGFGFEGIANTGDQDLLMNRTYVWLNPVGPIVELLSPGDNSRNNSRNVTFTCNASDSLGLVNATIYTNTTGTWNPTTINESINQRIYTINHQETNLSDGSYKWNCLFCDNSGNCEHAAKNHTFTVDTKLSINIISPVNTTYGNSSVTLNVSTSETANCSYSLNNQVNISLYNQSSSGSATINGTEGGNNVTVYCIDAAGNTNSSTAYFQIDEDPPDIIIHSPAPGLTDNQSITFNWSVTDNIDTHIDCNLTINGVVNESVNVVNDSTHNTTLNFTDGVYNWDLTCWDNTFNTNTTITRQLGIDTKPPNITSYSITPQVVINGSDVCIEISYTDANPNASWANITQNPTWKIYLPCNFIANQSGRYNVTFYANDSLGHESNTTGYFIAAPLLEFNATIRDRNQSGLNSTLTLYYENSLIQSNTSGEGDFSLQVPDHVFDLMTQGLNNSLSLLLRDVNLSANNNRNLSLDQIKEYPDFPDFLIVYAIESQYNISNATLEIRYNETECNEDFLGVYRCSSWNFTGRVCAGNNWVNVSGTATQDAGNNRFTIQVSGFSAYAIKQEPYCGDGVKNGNDKCDGSDFGGNSCSSYGFNSGSLKCRADCTIDNSGCYNKKGGDGGSSGGGGGSSSGISVKGETCFDGLLNQNETGVDCGGPCSPCPSCSDGVLNQGEEGIDCGGPCSPCSTSTTVATTSTATTMKATTISNTLIPSTSITTLHEEITTTTLTEEKKKEDVTPMLVVVALTLLAAALLLHQHSKKNTSTASTGIKRKEKHSKKNTSTSTGIKRKEKHSKKNTSTGIKRKKKREKRR